MNLLEVGGMWRIARPGLLLSQFRPAQDGADYVIEVMRDAAGELADGLELLCVPELLLERSALGDVSRNGGNITRLSCLRVLDLEGDAIHRNGLAGQMVAESQFSLPMSG